MNLAATLPETRSGWQRLSPSARQVARPATRRPGLLRKRRMLAAAGGLDEGKQVEDVFLRQRVRQAGGHGRELEKARLVTSAFFTVTFVSG